MHDDQVEPDPSQAEAMHLLSSDGWTEMADIDRADATKDQSRVETLYTDEAQHAESSGQSRAVVDDASNSDEPVVYKVYKIRWFGLMQLVLLNIVVSWDVSTTVSIEKKISSLISYSGCPSPQLPTQRPPTSPPHPASSTG